MVSSPQINMFSFVFIAVGCTILCILFNWIYFCDNINLGPWKAGSLAYWETTSSHGGQLSNLDRALCFLRRHRIRWGYNHLFVRLMTGSVFTLPSTEKGDVHLCILALYLQEGRTFHHGKERWTSSQLLCKRVAKSLARSFSVLSITSANSQQISERPTGPSSENIALGPSICSCNLLLISSADPTMSEMSITFFLSLTFFFTVILAFGRYAGFSVWTGLASFLSCSLCGMIKGLFKHAKNIEYSQGWSANSCRRHFVLLLVSTIPRSVTGHGPRIP